MAKKFHLGDLLSVTTGRLLSPTHMDGIYDILNYMTGDDLFTHQLPRASRECAPILVGQHPWLAKVDHSAVNTENWQNFLADMVAKYGEFHDVIPMHPDDHEVKDPIEELIEMRGAENVIIVQTDEEPSPYGEIGWKTDGEEN